MCNEINTKGLLMKTHNDRIMPMKRQIMYFRVIKILLLCMLVSGAVFAQDGNQVAMITKINGKLEFRATSDDDWTTAQPRSPLHAGNQLRTGTGDKAIIIYNSTGTRVLINENTEIEIQADIEQDGGKPSMERTRLILGEIYNQAAGNYQVETPSAVASVRGTEFNVLTVGGSDSYIGVEGVIEVMNAFGSIILNQLQQTTVAKNQAPAEPSPISKREANRRTQWTNTVEPTWEMNIVPEGGSQQAINVPFNLTIQARRDGSIDNDATFALTEFSVDPDVIEFSSDGGRTYTGDVPAVTLLGGQAMLTARITEEATVMVTAAAEDAETAMSAISAAEPKERKNLELIFTDPDGNNQRTINIELEEK